MTSTILNTSNWQLWIRGKKALLNLINHQPDISKIYLYAKDPYEEKDQLLINKPKILGLNHGTDVKAFIEYSNSTDKIH